jgi:poly(3-hydroxybutyrate) depolymerase
MRGSRIALLSGLVVASCLVKGMDVDSSLDDGSGGSGASNPQAGSTTSGSPGSSASSAGGASSGTTEAGAGNESSGDSGSAGNGGAMSSSGSGGSAMAGNGGSQVGGGGSGGSGGSSTAEPSEGCDKSSQVTFESIPGEPPNGFGEGGYVTIMSGGVDRSFALRLPDDYDPSHPYPLIFGFHWRGGTSANVDSGGSTGYEGAHFGLQKLSNNGAIFVAPTALGLGWDNTDGQDLQFVDDMVALIEENYCVDKKRLFANGFSWGGGMSHAIACDRANVFRGVAIYNGAELSGCEDGTDPIPYWIMAGLEDTTTGLNMAVPMRDRFVASNGCTVPAEEPERPPPPQPYLNPGGHVCTDYSGCSSGFPVRWCVHQSGHTSTPVDGTNDGFNSCAIEPSTCSALCPCSWVPQDVWEFFSSL